MEDKHLHVDFMIFQTYMSIILSQKKDLLQMMDNWLYLMIHSNQYVEDAGILFYLGKELIKNGYD